MKNFNWIVLVIGMLLYAIIILNAADAQDDLEFTAPRTSANSMAVTNNAAVGGQLAVEGILNASNSTASVDTVDATGSGRFVLGVTTPVILMPGSTLVIQSATQSTTFTVNNNGRIAVNGIVFASPSMYYDGASRIRTNGQISAQQMVSAGTRDHTNAATRLAASLNDTGVTPAGEARLFLLEARGNYGMSFLFDGQAASDLNIYYATPGNPRVAGQFYDYSANDWIWTANTGAGVQGSRFFVSGDGDNGAGTYAGYDIIAQDYNNHSVVRLADGRYRKRDITDLDGNPIDRNRLIQQETPVLRKYKLDPDGTKPVRSDYSSVERYNDEMKSWQNGVDSGKYDIVRTGYLAEEMPDEFQVKDKDGNVIGYNATALAIYNDNRLTRLELQVAELLGGN